MSEASIDNPTGTASLESLDDLTVRITEDGEERIYQDETVEIVD